MAYYTYGRGMYGGPQRQASIVHRDDQIRAVVATIRGTQFDVDRSRLLCPLYLPDRSFLWVDIYIPPQYPYQPPAGRLSIPCAHPLVDNRNGIGIIHFVQFLRWNPQLNLTNVVVALMRELCSPYPKPIPPPVPTPVNPPPDVRQQNASEPPPQSRPPPPIGEGRTNGGSVKERKKKGRTVPDPIPHIPNEFAALDQLTDEEMEALLTNDSKFFDFVQELDVVKSGVERKDSMEKRNAERAKENLSYEERIVDGNLAIQGVRNEKSELSQKRDVLTKKLNELRGKFSDESLRQLLDEKLSLVSVESETSANDFLESKMSSKDFVREFCKLREVFHRYRIIREWMREKSKQ